MTFLSLFTLLFFGGQVEGTFLTLYFIVFGELGGWLEWLAHRTLVSAPVPFVWLWGLRVWGRGLTKIQFCTPNDLLQVSVHS